MEMEMEKAKDTQRASERRNRQFGSLQMSGNWKGDGEGQGQGQGEGAGERESQSVSEVEN